MSSSNLTSGNLFGALLRFSVPFLLASILQACYGAADLLIVGQFSTPAQVAAVSTSSQVMQMLTSVILGLTTGGTILIGQYLGAKKSNEIARTIGSEICLFGTLAAVITALLLWLCPNIVGWMNTPADAVQAAREYLYVCASGVVFIVGYNAVSGIFRGLGDSKTPLLFIAIACAVNILGDLLLVAVFHMGAKGAAIATISAQGISLLCSLLFLKKRGFSFAFSGKDIGFHFAKIKRIFSLGLPIAVQDGLIGVSFLLITAVINNMGLIQAASVGVVEKIIVFAMLPIQAVASAVAVMTAQNVGAQNLTRAKKGMWCAIGMVLFWGVGFCLLAQGISTWLTALFSNDAQVIQMSALYLRSYSIDCIAVCFVFCMNSFFSGCSHALFAMAHSLLATFCVRIPLAYFIASQSWGNLYYIGLASPMATACSLVICLCYLKSGRWKPKLQAI